MTTASTTITFALFSLVALGCNANASTTQDAPVASAEDSSAAKVKRGKYLLHAGLCIDCHTPFVLGADGPAPDMTRLMSGHPADVVMPPPPAGLGAGPWVAAFGATNTAFAGPWGVSFSANLTPHPETGIGAWTEQTFIDTIRTGRHMGKGRAILPPMPYQLVANYTDEDLAAIFAYLQSITPIDNRVPQPVAPQ
jgi:hypothetical protein